MSWLFRPKSYYCERCVKKFEPKKVSDHKINGKMYCKKCYVKVGGVTTSTFYSSRRQTNLFCGSCGKRTSSDFKIKGKPYCVTCHRKELAKSETLQPKRGGECSVCHKKDTKANYFHIKGRDFCSKCRSSYICHYCQKCGPKKYLHNNFRCCLKCLKEKGGKVKEIERFGKCYVCSYNTSVLLYKGSPRCRNCENMESIVKDVETPKPSQNVPPKPPKRWGQESEGKEVDPPSFFCQSCGKKDPSVFLHGGDCVTCNRRNKAKNLEKNMNDPLRNGNNKNEEKEEEEEEVDKRSWGWKAEATLNQVLDGEVPYEGLFEQISQSEYKKTKLKNEEPLINQTESSHLEDEKTKLLVLRNQKMEERLRKLTKMIEILQKEKEEAKLLRIQGEKVNEKNREMILDELNSEKRKIISAEQKIKSSFEVKFEELRRKQIEELKKQEEMFKEKLKKIEEQHITDKNRQEEMLKNAHQLVSKKKEEEEVLKFMLGNEKREKERLIRILQGKSVEEFLSKYGLSRYYDKFREDEVKLEDIFLFQEEDDETLDEYIPKTKKLHRRKLINALKKERVIYEEVSGSSNEKLIHATEELIFGEYSWFGKSLKITEKYVFYENGRYEYEKMASNVCKSEIKGVEYIFVWDASDGMLRVVVTEKGEEKFFEKIGKKVFTKKMEN